MAEQTLRSAEENEFSSPEEIVTLEPSPLRQHDIERDLGRITQEATFFLLPPSLLTAGFLGLPLERLPRTTLNGPLIAPSAVNDLLPALRQSSSNRTILNPLVTPRDVYQMADTLETLRNTAEVILYFAPPMAILPEPNVAYMGLSSSLLRLDGRALYTTEATQYWWISHLITERFVDKGTLEVLDEAGLQQHLAQRNIVLSAPLAPLLQRKGVMWLNAFVPRNLVGRERVRAEAILLCNGDVRTVRGELLAMGANLRFIDQSIVRA